MAERWPISPREPEPHTVSLRFDAAFAHGSIVLFGFGILIATMIWSIHKDKARTAAFQALQAAIWQIIFVAFMLLLDRIAGRLFLLALIRDLVAGDTSASDNAQFYYRVLLVLIGAPFMITALYAAWRTWKGYAFRYPVIASWLDK